MGQHRFDTAANTQTDSPGGSTGPVSESDCVVDRLQVRATMAT